MNNPSFSNDLSPLTNRAASSSGDGGPEPFDRKGDGFTQNWSWGIVVAPLQPGQTATCNLKLGVDDNGSLLVDGRGVTIKKNGKYHGGPYSEDSDSFPINPGHHQVSLTYENVSLPADMENLAILDYSVNIEVSDATSSSSSSYVPDTGHPDPVDTGDDGDDTPCECSSSTSPSSSYSPSSSSCPCQQQDNGEGDDGEEAETCTCDENAGGSSSGAPARRAGSARSSVAARSSAAGKRVTAQTRKAEMLWRTNFGSFRGMTGLPQGLLELVGSTFNPELWSPAALHYWHPMASEITSAAAEGIGESTAFQIKNGARNINYFRYAGSGSGGGGSSAASSVGPIAGSAKRGGSAQFSMVSARSSFSDPCSLSVRSNAGSTVSYAASSPSSLQYATGYKTKNMAEYTREDFTNKLDIVRAADGSIRQIRNLWDGLANVEAISSSGYRLAFYLPAQVGGKDAETGLYAVTGTPFKTFTFSGDTTSNKLTIVEQTEGRAPFTTKFWQGACGAWNMAQGEGEDTILTLKEKQVLSADAWKLVTTVQRGETGAPISCVCETFAVTRNGNLCTSRIEGYGTSYARETTYTYDSTGRVATETAPDGSVKTWAYDRFGREILSTVPWAGGGDKATYTSYRDETQADPDILTRRVTLTATATELWQSKYTYVEANHVRRVEKRTTALGEEAERQEIKETWLGTAPGELTRGRLKMKQGPDGLQTVYSYEPTEQYGALYKVTAETQWAGAPVPGQSTRTITYVSEQGNHVRYEKHALLTGGEWEMTEGSTYEYDSENRWIKRTRSNGRVSERALMCCGPLWEKDEDGVLTTYTYNTARQLVETIRSEIADGTTTVTPETIVGYTRDALGRVVESRQDTGPMVRTQQTRYDLLGRVVEETDALGRTTVHTYSADGLTETVTTPSGATLVTQKHADGTVLHRKGTGQQEEKHGVEATENGIVVTVSVSGANGWVMSESRTMNGFGETTRMARAHTAGGVVADTFVYDDRGRLVREQTEGQAPALHAYDAFGNRVKTTVPLAEVPTVLNSRITDMASTVERREDGIYRITTVTNYTAEGLPVVAKRADLISALSAVLAGKTILTGARGNDSVEWEEFAAPAVREKKKTESGVAGTSVTRVVDDFTTSATDYAGVTASQRRTYTETGLTVAVTDPRGNTSVSVYDIAGRLLSATDAAGNATVYAYEAPFDQPTCVTDALGQTACYAYDLRGRKQAEWGTARYPAAYGYDDADRIVSLTTWRASAETLSTDPRERTDGDTTRWSYDAATGLLLQKTYADGSAVKTTYDAWNRIATVVNARGTVTTYAYAPLTGELIGMSADDGQTPAVTYQYNHLGQTTGITDAGGTRTYTYNKYAEQETERTSGLVESSQLTARDAYGRSAGYTLMHAGLDVQQTSWLYDGVGRLSNILLNEIAKPFTYGYNVQNGMLETLDYPNTLKRWYTLEDARDLPVKIDYLRPGSANYPAKTDYAYDPLGRPSEKKDFFNTPTPDLTHAYTYNTRNELTADAMSRGGTFSYAYDNIGNRTSAQEGSEAPATAYTANELNQYAAIREGEEAAFAPTYDADGNQTAIRTSTGVWIAEYNALNQATRFTQGARRIECIYDFMNRRVEKAVYEGETLMSKKRFIYRGYLQIAELDATHATETTRPVLRKTYLWDPAEPVATRILVMSLFDEQGVYKEDLYYTHDALKNTTALFGIKAGRRTLYEYGPYGSIVRQEGDAAEENPFRYSSEYLDEETGLIAFTYRNYNPVDGRWGGREPLGEAGAYMLYAYAANSGSMYFDSLGFNVYAIDGTNYNVRKHKEQQSNVYDFYKRAKKFENAEYYGGPGSDSAWITLADITGWFGPGYNKVKHDVLTDICNDFCANKSVTINLVGWSRGAAIAQEVARTLGNKGCCCGGKQHKPIRVNFLGMYDAVGMNMFGSYDEQRPDNIDHYHHATKTEDQTLYPTLKSGDSNERSYRNKDGSGSNHTDIGGGIGAKPNPAHSAMVRWAKNSGVKIDTNNL